MMERVLLFLVLVSLALVAETKKCQDVYLEIVDYLDIEQGAKSHEEQLKIIFAGLETVESFEECPSLKTWLRTLRDFSSVQDEELGGRKTAVIGGGPSALASAAMLVNLGFKKIVVFAERGADYSLKHVINAFPTAVRDDSAKKVFKKMTSDLAYGMRSLMEELGFPALAGDAKYIEREYHYERKRFGNPFVLRHSVLCRFLRLSLERVGVRFLQQKMDPQNQEQLKSLLAEFSVVVIATGSSDHAGWRQFFTNAQNAEKKRKEEVIVREFSVLKSEFVKYNEVRPLVEIAFVINRKKEQGKPNYCNHQGVGHPEFVDPETHSFRIFRDMNDWCQIIVKLLPSQESINPEINVFDNNFKDLKWRDKLQGKGSDKILFFKEKFGLSEEEIKELKVYSTSPPKLFHDKEYEDSKEDRILARDDDVADTFNDRTVAIFMVGDVVRSALPDWGMGTNDAAAMANELRNNFVKEIFDSYSWKIFLSAWTSTYSRRVWEREVVIHHMIQKFQADVYSNIKKAEDKIQHDEESDFFLQVGFTSLNLKDRLLIKRKMPQP
eukprot:GILJ01001426.1.p1 GENE.GILJ01001426.1~~GILJ01001426.1.p1  ORF type:complete len:552 (+),score=85.81 GILJ01001426.1:924-2579(+)